jgi:hypothetical protein
VQTKKGPNRQAQTFFTKAEILRQGKLPAQAIDSTCGKLIQGLKNMINRYVQYHKARVDDIQIIPPRDISFGL